MASAKKKGAGTVIDADSIVEAIASGLNSSGVQTTIGTEDSASQLTDFCSTGAALLDLAISNRPNGGIACGRITELTGLEGTGKSLISAHMIANVQKEGGIAALLDSETAVNEEFFEAVGIDMSKLVYSRVKTVEEIFESIVKIVEIVRKSGDTSRKVLIVVDSLAGAPTKKELAGDFDKEGYATDKALIISRAMRKITQLIADQKVALVFTNQLRHKMNAAPFSDPWTTSGGKAIPFHASTRIRLTQTGKIKLGDTIVGVKLRASIDKNRLGPPHRKVDFEVYFDRGIDDISSWIAFLKDNNIIDGTNGRFRYISSDGEEFKFMRGDWSDFAEKNPEIIQEIYTRMCDVMIMKYKTDNINTLDGTAVVTTEEEV